LHRWPNRICPFDVAYHFSTKVESLIFVLQVYLNEGANYKARTDLIFLRTLDFDYSRMKYRRRKNEHKTVIHWGQRKLLMSEIEFLSMYGKPGHPVVYAGAAPGTHIKKLATMFPDLDFVLFDPAPFNLMETEQITLRQEMFTDEVAYEFEGRSPLFICDIRTADWQEMEEDENEKQIQEDMNAQWRWHEIMKPLKSMLKFRLPWTPGKTLYLGGTIFLPVWGPTTTTEARLIPETGTLEYDNTAYEEQMFYFNTIARVGLYKHDGSGIGICHCYDCTAEVHILTNYLKMRGELRETAVDQAMIIAKLVDEVSAGCATRRTLADPNSDPEKRKQGIRKRQWIDNMPAYEHAKWQKNLDTQIQDTSERYGPGHKILLSMGHMPGEGLGPKSEGITAPIEASNQHGRRGLGFNVENRLTRGEMSRNEEAHEDEARSQLPQVEFDIPAHGRLYAMHLQVGCLVIACTRTVPISDVLLTWNRTFQDGTNGSKHACVLGTRDWTGIRKATICSRLGSQENIIGKCILLLQPCHKENTI
jgi:cap2 methyltransferase